MSDRVRVIEEISEKIYKALNEKGAELGNFSKIIIAQAIAEHFEGYVRLEDVEVDEDKVVEILKKNRGGDVRFYQEIASLINKIKKDVLKVMGVPKEFLDSKRKETSSEVKLRNSNPN